VCSGKKASRKFPGQVVFDSEAMIVGRAGELMFFALAFLLIFLIVVKLTFSILFLSWNNVLQLWHVADCYSNLR
jgi:hypothetical protein